MMNPNPVMYVASQGAMDHYMREEGIPAKRLPDLVANDEDVFAGVRGILRALRGALVVRKQMGRQPRAIAHGVVSK